MEGIIIQVHFLKRRNDSLGLSGERIVRPDSGKEETAILLRGVDRERGETSMSRMD